jgi:hypothetical protein
MMNLARIKSMCLAVLLAHTLGCAAEGETDEGETVELEGQTQAVVNPVDWGYSSLPRGMYQADNFGGLDYCRFVGNSPNIFISCKLNDYSNEYAHNSLTGIDQGYSNRPRGFEDFDGDGFIDFCRYVGNSPNIVKRCLKGRPTTGGKVGFEMDQYWNPAGGGGGGGGGTSPYRVINVYCQCSGGPWIQNNLCLDPGNGSDWAACYRPSFLMA